MGVIGLSIPFCRLGQREDFFSLSPIIMKNEQLLPLFAGFCLPNVCRLQVQLRVLFGSFNMRNCPLKTAAVVL